MPELINAPITVEILPAKNGDCILIRSGSFVMLIDGGYDETYREFVKARLAEFKSENLDLSCLIVTHVDKDHIGGIIPLLSENLGAQEKKTIGINDIWHNSYRHLHFQDPVVEVEANEASMLSRLQPVENPVVGESLISARQGSSLASLILKGGYSWNNSFAAKAVIASESWIDLVDDVAVQVLSPTQEKLEKLKKYWRRELLKLGFSKVTGQNPAFDDAYEFLLLREKEVNETTRETTISAAPPKFETLFKMKFEEDHSPTNGSSIAFILKIGNRRLLFLGDSHPGLIKNQLESYYKKEKFPLQFDLIKISHHGSCFNSSLALLDIVDAPNYVISTNGEHHHPNMETITWIVGRPANYNRSLYFNYAHPIAVQLNKNKDWMDKFHFSVHYPEQQPGQFVTIK